jgi:hypothetical protein
MSGAFSRCFCAAQKQQKSIEKFENFKLRLKQKRLN